METTEETRELTEAEMELEREVEKLVAVHGHIKINLVCDDGMNEGVWATPCTEQSATRARDDNSIGEEIFVRLCNQPLGWGRWGDMVRAITKGDSRPQARVSDQLK